VLENHKKYARPVEGKVDVNGVDPFEAILLPPKGFFVLAHVTLGYQCAIRLCAYEGIQLQGMSYRGRRGGYPILEIDLDKVRNLWMAYENPHSLFKNDPPCMRPTKSDHLPLDFNDVQCVELSDGARLFIGKKVETLEDGERLTLERKKRLSEYDKRYVKIAVFFETSFERGLAEAIYQILTKMTGVLPQDARVAVEQIIPRLEFLG